MSTTAPSSGGGASSSSSSNTLRFEDGAIQFRQRLAVSILSNRPLLIKNIRFDALEPGMRPYEISFLRLLDRITNGSRIEINATGTQLRFAPGILTGGLVEHDCPVGNDGDDDNNNNATKTQDQDSSDLMYRSIGWYLEGIFPLAPFGKNDLTVEWTGITNGTCCGQDDPSVDYFKASALPMLQQFGIVASDDMMENTTGPAITVLRRGAAPLGGGKVRFHCPLVKALERPIDWTDAGKIKRVRGTAVSCTLVSSSSTARVAYAAKGLLQRLLPDVWIHTDVHTRKQHVGCGPSPALTVHLTAQSTTGVLLTAEAALRHRELPEDLGTRVAAQLLQQVQFGGCVDSDLQSLTLLLMCLTPEDVSRLRIGRLTPYTIESLRLYKRALGVEFKLNADEESKTVLLSCVGTGYRNMARAST